MIVYMSASKLIPPESLSATRMATICVSERFMLSVEIPMLATPKFHSYNKT